MSQSITLIIGTLAIGLLLTLGYIDRNVLAQCEQIHSAETCLNTLR